MVDLLYTMSLSPLQFWFSWRYQLKEMQKEYHAVAVDLRSVCREFMHSWILMEPTMQAVHCTPIKLVPPSSVYRGYGDSDHPLDKDGYEINNLVKDIVELVRYAAGASAHTRMYRVSEVTCCSSDVLLCILKVWLSLIPVRWLPAHRRVSDYAVYTFTRVCASLCSLICCRFLPWATPSAFW